MCIYIDIHTYYVYIYMHIHVVPKASATDTVVEGNMRKAHGTLKTPYPAGYAAQ